MHKYKMIIHNWEIAEVENSDGTIVKGNKVKFIVDGIERVGIVENVIPADNEDDYKYEINLINDAKI